jgi:hypothetical protein
MLINSPYFKCFDRDDLLDDDVAADVDKLVRVRVLKDGQYSVLPAGISVVRGPGTAPAPVMKVILKLCTALLLLSVIQLLLLLPATAAASSVLAVALRQCQCYALRVATSLLPLLL